jgi:hypothetical protein
MLLSVVVFPAPLPPMSVTISACPTVNEIPFTASMAP